MNLEDSRDSNEQFYEFTIPKNVIQEVYFQQAVEEAEFYQGFDSMTDSEKAKAFSRPKHYIEYLLRQQEELLQEKSKNAKRGEYEFGKQFDDILTDFCRWLEYGGKESPTLCSYTLNELRNIHDDWKVWWGNSQDNETLLSIKTLGGFNTEFGKFVEDMRWHSKNRIKELERSQGGNYCWCVDPIETYFQMFVELDKRVTIKCFRERPHLTVPFKPDHDMEDDWSSYYELIGENFEQEYHELYEYRGYQDW